MLRIYMYLYTYLHIYFIHVSTHKKENRTEIVPNIKKRFSLE